MCREWGRRDKIPRQVIGNNNKKKGAVDYGLGKRDRSGVMGAQTPGGRARMRPAGRFCVAWEGTREWLRDLREFAEKKGSLEKNFANRFILAWIDFSTFLPAFFESKQASKKQGIEFSAPLISIFQLDRFA